MDRHIDICQYVSVDPLCCPAIESPLSESDAEVLAGLLKVLADPVRLRLVSVLVSAPTGEICACDLPTLLGRSQPTVSHHLGLLVRAGVIEREQRGKWAWFRLRDGALDAIGGALRPHQSSLVVH